MRVSTTFLFAAALATLDTFFVAAIPTESKLQVNRVLNDRTPQGPSFNPSCTAVYTGVNSEGGGGPGQAPIDMTQYSLKITGQFIQWQKSSLSASGEKVDLTVKASDYGGGYDVDFAAGWFGGDNKWTACSATVNGQTVQGTVGASSISSNIVSTTTDECTITFTCVKV